MDDDAADIVWDRALDILMSDAQMMDVTEGIRAGDRMLADAIHLDGCFARNGAGGMPNLDAGERDAGIAALRWFGFDEAADIIEHYVDRSGSRRWRARAEGKATDAYNRLDVDKHICERLRTRLEDTPHAFAPVDLPRPQRR